MICRSRGAGAAVFGVVTLFSLSLAAVDAWAQAGELSIVGGPVSLNFASRRVGSGPSATQTFTIQNTGELALQIADVSIPGSNSEDWVVENFAGSLGAGATEQINVQFSPSAFATGFGAQNATVVVTSDDPVDPDETVTLNGTGTSPFIQVSSTADMSFGNVRVGDTSSPITRTVTNQNIANASLLTLDQPPVTFTGTGAARFNPIAPADLTITPGQTVQDFGATFSPNADGGVSAVLHLLSDDPQTDDIQINTSGIGVSPEITLDTPSTLDFGDIVINTTSGELQVTVTNSPATNAAEAYLTIHSAGIIDELTGEDNFDFTNGTGALSTPFILDFTESATWMVSCDPEDASPATKTATFRVNTDDPDDSESTIDIALACNGTATEIILKDGFEDL